MRGVCRDDHIHHSAFPELQGGRAIMNEQASVPRIKRHEVYIVALLEHPTLQKAAAAVGISDVTLWRCMKQPEFAEAYRKARKEAFSQSVGRLQHASSNLAKRPEHADLVRRASKLLADRRVEATRQRVVVK